MCDAPVAEVLAYSATDRLSLGLINGDGEADPSRELYPCEARYRKFVFAKVTRHVWGTQTVAFVSTGGKSKIQKANEHMLNYVACAVDMD